MIDLNSDVGEGFGVYKFGHDEELLNVITSANIACGFHAGDPTVIARTVNLAVSRGVSIGAHVSYPDRVGFGRRFIDVNAEDLVWDIIYQIGALDGIAKTAGGRVSYIKPHGALYNRIVADEIQAKAVVEAVAKYDKSLAILTLPGSVIAPIAESWGISIKTECFADREYTDSGELVPRSQLNAVIHDQDSVVERAVRLASLGTVNSIKGKELEIKARSICIHSDTPDAGNLGRKIRSALSEAGIEISPFA